MSSPLTLIEALQRTAAVHGDDRGVTYHLTVPESQFRGYAELDRHARTIADALSAGGYAVGDRAVVALSPGLAWADALFGILFAGLTFVPAPTGGYGDASALASRVAGISRGSDATVIITDAAMRAVLDESGTELPAPVVLLEDLLASGSAGAWSAPQIDGETTAVLFFTSGSTGDPKGVIGTHSGLLATVEGCDELFGIGPESTVVGWAPLHHAMGLLLQVIVPVASGARTVITTTELFQRRPLSWLQLISLYRGTVSVAGNFAYALCVQFATDERVAELDLSSLTTLISGSEPVRPETVAAFIERFAPAGLDPTTIAPALGMTEAMLVSCKPIGTGFVVRRVDADRLEQGQLVPSDDDSATRVISNGRPPSSTTIRIVDAEAGEPVADGTVGEIWISSPMVSPGYFRRPDATAETFGHRLPGDDRSYMRSGDLGVVLDGELYITGRLKELIILRGRNVYPQDIEAAASALSPALGIAAAFELDDHPAPVGIIVEYDTSELPDDHDHEQLLALVGAELVRRFSLPSVAVGLVAPGSVPRTATGKVRRKPTRSLVEADSVPFLHASGFGAR
ncbi:fatty acyl-AMP ligase [Microbacterium allomyrinae]|uniref:Fatty acyl-AMP ligase n=1 Tax=Microbacterium allomyrinae TaxID=2830666 RepID=A0A9X1LYE9_9MICO|nr:fatty acyl-AMP ligase [Microbacterium allomyrinae]MCC2034023.1 fatty acyl-AMP ligase [Microbacterium allomyrinae]